MPCLLQKNLKKVRSKTRISQEQGTSSKSLEGNGTGINSKRSLNLKQADNWLWLAKSIKETNQELSMERFKERGIIADLGPRGAGVAGVQEPAR
jgi:hypothetical protein